MPGTFDNETRLYLFDEWYDEGDWFEDEDGFLYIVPVGDGAETIGPDNETEDWLNAYYRDNEEEGWVPHPSDELLKKHGLHTIPPVLRRFNPYDGYYHA